MFAALHNQSPLITMVGRLPEKREVAGSIPGTGPIPKGLKITIRNEGSVFALQAARP